MSLSNRERSVEILGKLVDLFWITLRVLPHASKDMHIRWRHRIVAFTSQCTKERPSVPKNQSETPFDISLLPLPVVLSSTYTYPC